jgi:hypothetical protein
MQVYDASKIDDQEMKLSMTINDGIGESWSRIN